MSQRGKKKYVEKLAPDINTKPKYAPKPISNADEEKSEKYHDPDRTDNQYKQNSNKNRESERFNKNQRSQKSYNNEENHQKPSYYYEKNQKPKYVVKNRQDRENNLKQQLNYERKGNYERNDDKQLKKQPKLLQKYSSNIDEQNCVICSEFVKKRDQIWTCSCCYISMHLKCIKTWILNVNKDKKKNQIIYSWTCPQCKFQYNEIMPKYYCFCGKFKDPEYERYLDPHSCGQICARKRGLNCPHPCPQLCHKGKCKPCEHEGTLVSCQCGKSSRIVKCSEEKQNFQCGKKCQKILNCCKHKCERNCHHGECFPCKKKHIVSCYCGKNQDVVDCIQNFYSCEEICRKTLNCGFHQCQVQCHEGKCDNCQKTPQLQKTCSCGAYTIQMLTGDEFYRQKCEDPIPTCGMPCKKLLSCGHKCSKSCHEGNCSDCKIIVNQYCLCGLTSRKIQCFKAHSHKQTLKCQNICKRKRSCGQHNCNTQCCPYRNSSKPEEHSCQLTCPKMLNCQKHTCGQNCHLGLCKKCPVIYSQAQPCPCGKTSLRPPILCGTIVPECDNICGKQMECGHKCTKVCHYGPCKCFQDTVVTCRCGKEKINTTCGREALCLNKCSNILQCGHKCGIQCHRQSCKQAHKHHPCRKICQKIRTDCHHSCGQHCHPQTKCAQYECQAQIFIKCECGHRQTSILCGMIEDKKYKKQIKCNNKCQNLKRFDILYKGKQIYYPTNMVHFGLKHIDYIQNLEKRLAKFILQSQDPILQLQYKFTDNQYKLILLNLFENHYHLNAYFYRHKKFSSFTLAQTESTMIPKPNLSEYSNKVAKGQIKRTNLPFQFTVSFQCEQKQKAEIILRSLKPYLHKYYIERKDKISLVYCWSEEDGYKILNSLQNQNPHIQFKGEKNTFSQDIQIIADTDIIEVEVNEQEIQNNLNQNKLEFKLSQEKKQQIQIAPASKTNKSQEPRNIDKIVSLSEEYPKKKIAGAPKIFIKKSNMIFRPKQYPESEQNVQDIYLIDEDEIYNQQTDWQKLVQQLSNKNMGPEATEWKIRSFLMINSFHPISQDVFRNAFDKLLKMYKKDKIQAKRILELKKIEMKMVKQELQYDGIYLSNHEPEMLAYLMLFNYFCTDKINFQLEDYHQNSQQVTLAQQLLLSVEENNLEEFYNIFRGSNYILSCALIPFIHAARENTIDLFDKKQKILVKNLFKHLLFESEENLIDYWKAHGIQVGIKFNKKLEDDVYYMKEGNISTQRIKDNAFIDGMIKSKRDKKYFLVEPQQLIDDKWMTRSFFAFGDFKQSISNKYMVSLIKSLKN